MPNIRPFTLKKALYWSLFWIVLALSFNLGIYLFLRWQGSPLAIKHSLDFFTGYLLEKALSIDNLFVFVLIFQHFNIPFAYQRRVLNYGIISAILLRGILIVLGTSLVTEFHFILYLFGLFLIYTGIKMVFAKPNAKSFEAHKIIRLLQRFFRFTPVLHGEKFIIKENKIHWFTPLFLALCLIEISDLIFATDSIPAILAITHNAFIVLSSNIFAILGLRSLYFLLAGLMQHFYYLKHALALILVIIGIKMLLVDIFPISTVYTLIFIVIVLAIAAYYSIKKAKEPPNE